MTLADYLQVIRRLWWLVLLFIVLGAAVGFGVSYVSTPTYNARATVYVSTSSGGSLSDLQQGNAFSTQRALTYAGLATTDSTLSRAVSALGGEVRLATLSDEVSAVARENTSLIDISASGPSARLVADEANAVATSLIAEVAQLDGSSADAQVRLSVVQAAQTPTVAASPRPRYSTLAGGAVGLALGVALLVVLVTTDQRIRTLAELPGSRAVRSAVSVPRGRYRSRARGGLIGHGPRDEALRNLRGILQLGAEAGPSLAVVGIDAETDAMRVAHEVAETFVETGSSVVVIEAADVDVRGGTTESDAGEGLSALLHGRAELDSAIDVVERDYAVMHGGVDVTSAVKSASGATLRALVHELAGRYDYVVVAGPPLVERSDAAVIAAVADDCLVVAEAGATTRTDFLLALELLSGVNVSEVTVALDDVRLADAGAIRGAD